MIRTAPKPTPATTEPAVPELMADFMLERVAASGSVDRDTLLLRFTGAQIDTHFEAAKEIAGRRAPQ